MASDKPECYIGRKPCGCVVAATVNDRPDWVAANLADFVRSGLTVEPSTKDYVKAHFGRCKCGPAQESLL